MGKSQSVSATPPKSGAQSDFPATPASEQTVVVTHTLKRLDLRVLWDASLGAFSLEQGFGYTLGQFLRRPRASFEAYLGADRLKFSNPLKIVMVLTAAATFANYQFDMFGALGSPDQAGSNADISAQAGEFFKRNYNLILLGTLPLMALVTRVLYWKRAYNIVEHLALNAFIFGVTTVWYLVSLPLTVLWPPFGFVNGVGYLVYQTWVYRRVLGPGWGRAIAATLLITVGYLILVSIITNIYVLLVT
tara:strand:- start:145 stop:885 length:741 start_codon:yes stop_codon:yes gene_type:complete